MILKELNHEIFIKYFKDNDKLHTKKSLLDALYALHAITYEFIEYDDKVRDRILKVIRKEQVKLENMRVINDAKNN